MNLETSSSPEQASTGVDAVSETRPPRQRFLVNRFFAWLWIGETVSTFGSHISGEGLKLAGIQLLQATPVQLSLLLLSGSLPVLCLSLFAGAWIDRLPLRTVLLVSDIGRALLLALVPLTFVCGWLSMPVLYGVTALVSVLTIFFTVALRSYVPRIVRVRNLVQSNSRLSMSESIAEIAGPPSATWLIQVLTAPLAIIFDALSFLFSAYCLWRIRIKDETETVSVSGESPEQADVIVPGQLWQEIGEGFAVLWRHPVLWMVALYTALFNFSGGTFATLYTLYIVRTLGLSYTFYGVLVALGGIGALLGSLLATPLACRLGVGRVMILGALLFGVLAFATPLAQNVREHSWLLLGMLMGSQLLGDCALMVYMVHEISWRQSCVPARFLGRVNACMHVLSEGIGPLGAILAALFCQWSGNIQLTLLLGACGMLIAACLLCYSPLWWIGELSTEEDSTAV